MVDLIEDQIRTCVQCSGPIYDPDGAIYDGAMWFCDVRCHSQWITKESGSFPA